MSTLGAKSLADSIRYTITLSFPCYASNVLITFAIQRLICATWRLNPCHLSHKLTMYQFFKVCWWGIYNVLILPGGWEINNVLIATYRKNWQCLFVPLIAKINNVTMYPLGYLPQWLALIMGDILAHAIDGDVDPRGLTVLHLVIMASRHQKSYVLPKCPFSVLFGVSNSNIKWARSAPGLWIHRPLPDVAITCRISLANYANGRNSLDTAVFVFRRPVPSRGTTLYSGNREFLFDLLQTYAQSF